MCETWDVDGLLAEIPNRLFLEWMVFWQIRAEKEEEAVRLAKRKGNRG